MSTRKSWHIDGLSSFSLDAAVKEIFPGSSVVATKLSFSARIMRAGSLVAEQADGVDLDYLFRAAIPALAIAMPFAVWWALLHPIMFGWGGAWLTLTIFGGLGVLCNVNLEDSFSSRVRAQLGVAKAASEKPEMTVALLKLIWAMRETRPPLATVVNPFVIWSNYSNNVNKFAIEPARNALKLLTSMDRTSKFDWGRRMEFDGFLSQIEGKLDVMDTVWDRSIKWWRELHNAAFYCGLFMTLVHLAMPLLKIWAGR